jgi:peptide deformylase
MILKVARMGNPVLRQVAKPVDPARIRTPEFQAFVDDMIETMYEYDGAGLAAPQVHVSLRVVVLEIHQHPRYPAAELPLTVLVNPEIQFLTEQRIPIWEGCLSIPDLRGQVPRIAHLEVSALDRHGEPQRFEFRDFPAAVIQHECDHLDGVLYIDRVADTTTLSFLREFQRYRSTEFAAD